MKPEDVTTSPYGRGTCAVCGREFNLRKDGLLRNHSAVVDGAARWCDGGSNRLERKT